MARQKKSSLFILIITLSLFAVFFAGNTLMASAQNTQQTADTTKLFCEGCELIKQRKYAEAAKVFEKVIETDLTRRGAHTNLSWMYLELGRYEDSSSPPKKKLLFIPNRQWRITI